MCEFLSQLFNDRSKQLRLAPNQACQNDDVIGVQKVLASLISPKLHDLHPLFRDLDEQGLIMVLQNTASNPYSSGKIMLCATDRLFEQFNQIAMPLQTINYRLRLLGFKALNERSALARLINQEKQPHRTYSLLKTVLDCYKACLRNTLRHKNNLTELTLLIKHVTDTPSLATGRILNGDNEAGLTAAAIVTERLISQQLSQHKPGSLPATHYQQYLRLVEPRQDRATTSSP